MTPDTPASSPPDITPVPAAAVVRGWYPALLGVITPVLVLGFLYSALADRLIFAGWALVVATGYTVALRQGLMMDWPRLQLAGFLALLLAGSAAWFAGIEDRQHEILDLGFRAVFPRLYFAAATRPATAEIAASVLALVGGTALFVGRRRQNSGGSR
jgi:hypothetical protein